MKHLFFFLSVPILLFMFACNENEADAEKLKEELREELKSEKENTEANPTNETPEISNDTQSGKFNVSELKNADIIEGLEITKIEYRPNQFFSIEFKGEKVIGGDIIYNEFEDSWEMNVDEEFLPKSSLVFNGSEYKLFKTIAVQNRDAFKKGLGGESVDMIQNGQGVWKKYTFENFSIGMTVDKGRYEVAYADFSK